MTMNDFVAGWVVAGSLFLAGCSGDDKSNGTPAGDGGEAATPTTSSAFDPCALLDKSEIQPIVSDTIVSADLEHEGDDLRCTWSDAETFGLLDVFSHHDLELYGFSSRAPSAVPITGVGDEAHLGGYSTVYVRVGERSFFAQGLRPVADGQVSAVIREAMPDEDEETLEENEAAYRLAKLVASKLD
jgi:hypothetical protein